MKKIGIILLAVAMLAVFSCASEGIKNDNSKNISRDKYTSGKLFIETLNPEAQYIDLIDNIESKVNQIQNRNLEFIQSAVGNYGNMPQNFQPSFNRGRPEQLPPDFAGRKPGERGYPEKRFDSFLEEQTLRQQNKSYYQSYVTPYTDVVSSYLEENDLENKYKIYEAALSWTWVSDETLNGEEEKWLIPSVFLENTSTYSSNPDYGNPVSDCEEQANTLASLLIASGEYNESTVRVAVGEVDFGSVSGGHAWVEIYEEGEWCPLDPTYGPYYDDESGELVSVDTSEVDYDKYFSSIYPAVEVWYYYNNEYFMSLGTQQNGDVPVSWNSEPESYQELNSQ